MAILTDTEISEELVKVSKRFNNILYATVGQFTDGIQNLSDLEQLYGRKNGEKWINTFSYEQGEIITYNGAIFVSLISNNLNNVPDENPLKWLPISSQTLQNGKYFAAAFCNFILNDNSVTILNNYNISSITNLSGYSVPSSGMIIFDIKFKESANITDSDYLVFPVIAATKSGIDSTNWAYTKMQGCELISKTALGFSISAEYFRGRQFSIIVVPKQY